MHDDRSIVERRLSRVVRERIDPAIRGARVTLDVLAWEVPGEPVPAAEAVVADYAPFSVGSPFGRPWGTTWFKLSGQVPRAWQGERVEARIDLGFSGMTGFQSEGLLWGVDDRGDLIPLRGIHPHNNDVLVAEHAVGDERVELLLEAASNPPFVDQVPSANSDLATAGTGPIYFLTQADLVVVNTEVAALREDIRALTGLMERLALDQPRRHEILRALESALDSLVLDDVVGSASEARSKLVDVLQRPAVPSAHRISAIGHAHIDTAWLWPLRETVRKCARTFSNVLALMDIDPEFKFGCSQAVQYEWMREHYPSIFEGIQRRVAQGRWIVIGGMWVEADANLTGGEALIRQFTHGQRYFEEHLGVTCTEVWIPDVFGYPASLPQIMKICGFERFLTQKLSWNKTNRFPHHSFWWEGIDGSTVFTHFPPVETYNAAFHAFELAHTVQTFTDKGRATRSLMPFGFGDGGGGPTRQMMEQFRRVRDLEGSPRVEIESPEQFFDAAIEEYPDAPRWVGELYLEMHRGTFTSQAATKAGNRRCELLLREAELWCVTAYGTTAEGGYPAADLDRLWKEVLLHQFHDILPGSSIGWVHREAEQTYAAVAAELEAIISAAINRVAAGRSVVANPAPYPIAGVVVIDDHDSVDDAADPLSAGVGQVLHDGALALVARAAPMSIESLVPLTLGDLSLGEVTVATGPPSPASPAPGGGRITLDNGLVRVVIDSDGCLSSIFDHEAGREVLASGARGNLLQLHEDFPNEFDAWDIEDFYRRSAVDLTGVDSIEVLDAGPLVARVRVDRSFRSSTVSQVLELRAGSRRLDIACEVDWHEHEHLLKVAFPVDVHAHEVAREIQFGHVKTPIHTNTSWDNARFEVCAHRWIDVCEPGFGVALLNDSKYGYDVTRTRAERHPDDLTATPEVTSTTMRLTLLRSARYPDPAADQGMQRFTYSVLSHSGDLCEVIAAGYHLNTAARFLGPTRRRPDDTGTALTASVVASTNSAVVIETVKPADDGSGDLIVRCYEALGSRSSTVLEFAASVTSARVVSARELALDDGVLAVDAGSITLQLRPFQILTIRVAAGVVGEPWHLRGLGHG